LTDRTLWDAILLLLIEQRKTRKNNMSTIQQMGKRKNELNYFIRAYAHNKGILSKLLWAKQMSETGNLWKGQPSIDYGHMYHAEVIEPATKLFNESSSDTTSTGSQLGLDVF
jgi:hypothetical protein